MDLLDLAGGVALVREFEGDYYTQTKRETTISIERAAHVERRLGVRLHFGRIVVSEQVVGFERRSITTLARLALEPLELPAATFATEAAWFSPPAEMLDGLEELPRLLGSLHAAEHALIALLPLWAMCDRWDIGGLSTNVHPETEGPTIFVYDGHPEGVGITERGFERFEGWVADTPAMLLGCPCEQGCPSCVQSPKCGNLNDLLDKCGARTLLDRLVEHA